MLGALATALLAAPAAACAQTDAIAYTSFRDGTAHVHAVNADGTGARALTRTRPAAFEGSPAYSPDGQRIVYTCGNFELCIMNADGSAPVRLTLNGWPQALDYDTSPAWSPDGTLIAFVHTTAGRDGISIIRPDGSGLRQLPVPAGVIGSPTFSADSKLVAFSHAGPRSDDEASATSSIRVIGVDGTGLRALTAPRVDATEPAWSPDGAHIAFTRTFENGPDQIAVVNADGSGLRGLTSRKLDGGDAAWSPDSARIVYTASGGRAVSLYHLPAVGGRPVRLNTGRGFVSDPAWQPHGAAASVPPPVPPAAPSIAGADARMVGVLIRALVGLSPVFAGLEFARTAGDMAATAAAMDGHARRILRAAGALRPSNRRMRSVRREVRKGMNILKGTAAELRRVARNARRRGRRLTATERQRALFTLLFAVIVPLGEASEQAQVPPAL